ncbi:MAG TPA: phosphodiester glycosidase family protein [Nocardioides sp.]|uniref:phosphodiester glycosidase family protein n=1 Tax=Nocardioides sp. TaxID=35761 RepID=UPI002E31431A|nr:phosphodiester glycosidase family protein [Nocardioides sp.]HEX5086938.1 phosphodiester glycosidase family protein [Nocardioides sp.]
MRRLLTAAVVLVSASALTVAPSYADRNAPTSHHRAPDSQTSDGVRGERALPVPKALRTPDVWTTLQAYPVAPGVNYEQFTLTGPRGVTRGQLMRINPATPGLGLDLVEGRNVASRHAVADMMDPNAVVGINGDFFDIRDTEAPLGVAKDRQRGIMNGVQSGWNSAFWVDAAGVPHIGDLYADAVLRQRPGLDVTTVNSPSVRRGGVGLYTEKWGTLAGYRVVDGHRHGVRMVVVRHGRVVSNRSRFPASLRVRDLVLVGRGRGAGELARLRAGQRLTANVSLSEDVAMAVTGNEFVLRDGRRVARDDVDLHPRTAIGIDHDTGQILLLVLDGRQSFSRGATMKELGRLFQRLGAEDALNLDGGGSSIMLARQADGSLAVLNSPSDGHPRPVANGLEVTYDPPPPPPAG